MESEWSARNRADQELRDIDRARAGLAGRATSPWWYRLGVSLATAALFAGIGLSVTDGASQTAAMTVIVLGAVVGPVVLLAALRTSTGVSVDRYAEGLGSWYAIVFGLFLIAFALQVGLGVPHALPVAGVLAGAATWLRERRIDDLVRRRIRLGPEGA